MWFDNWMDLWRTLMVGGCAYIVLVFFVRVSGKRTLSKMNAFDLIVTVALGSTLATILLTKDVALAEGTLALGLLIAAQYLVAWASVRSGMVRPFVKSEPAILYQQGEFQRTALKRERVTEVEVLAAIRANGATSLKQVQAVVLETDGTFSVLTGDSEIDEALLQNVRRQGQA
jgi:uncharacterized membrane protein YcaP (DUF421 family)